MNEAMLTECEKNGLSGLCGEECELFKNKTCEIYDEVLQNKKTKLNFIVFLNNLEHLKMNLKN